MRKSVFGVLAVAALAASSIAIDNAAARDHGAGGGRGGGAPAVSSGGGAIRRSAIAVALGPSAVARRGGAPFRQVFKPIAV